MVWDIVYVADILFPGTRVWLWHSNEFSAQPTIFPNVYPQRDYWVESTSNEIVEWNSQKCCSGARCCPPLET